MKKQYIIPIFVPHLGCPMQCTFCNQRNISGKEKYPTVEEIEETIEYYLDSFKDKESSKIEIAFFGGSFTGIDEEVQESFLKTAYRYIKEKKVHSIRVSTRPDYINKEILKRLKKYKVKVIELGVQSTNDYILARCKRGHTFEDVKKASKMIRWHGFKLGHQMMVGLPESTLLDEINTAKDLIKLKPKIVRIYPVLVIKGTELAKDYLKGEYEPLEVFQAVDRCKELCYLFEKKKIKVIRIGLQTTDTICSPEKEGSDVLAGPYHENFRGLVEASMWYDKIMKEIRKVNTKVKKLEIVVNPVNVDKVVGYRRENLNKLKELYELDVEVRQDEKMNPKKLELHVLERFKDFADD